MEQTNEGYVAAKIAALESDKLYRRQYSTGVIRPMPTKHVGPGENYDLVGSHVLPALLRETHDDKPGDV